MKISLQPPTLNLPQTWHDALTQAFELLWEKTELSRHEALTGVVPCVTIEWVLKATIQEINATYREKDRPTDVLSFPMLHAENGRLIGAFQPGDIYPVEDRHELGLGDIIIAPEVAADQAKQYGHTLKRELIFLALHGFAHLCGYDHEDEAMRQQMEQVQSEVMAAIALDRSQPNETAAKAEENQLKLWLDCIAEASNDLPFFEEMSDHLPVDTTPDGKPYRSGFIALVGRPNAGKSTLLNQFSGAHLAIVSRKAQTTRHSIRAVVTEDQAQYIFVDTPGMHIPHHQMGKAMMKEAWSSVKDADVILLMVDGHKGNITTIEEAILKRAKEKDLPIVLAINKVDDMAKPDLLPIIARYQDAHPFAAIVPISAKTGDGVAILKNELYKLLPEGPQYFSPDRYTDQSEKTLVAELIREQILHYTHDEIPHGTAVRIDVFDEGKIETAADLQTRGFVRIEATIFCNRKTHKGIVIGHRGQTLKRIGASARREIEAMLDCKVYLELFVKVRKDWQNEPAILADLAYDPLKL